MNRKHQIPLGRRAAFDVIAETSKSERVLIVCRSQIIRRQYERAILVRGGNLANVIFQMLADSSFEEAPHA